MSFTNRSVKNIIETELVRFATEINSIVVGGFSKLLNYAIYTLNLTNITSFSDNMYSKGDIYKNHGFCKEYNIPVDYKYTKAPYKGLFYKSTFMKSKIKTSKELKYIDNLTENELMLINGYSRYYDAGKIKWKYKGR
jgi:hypothetical protein